MLDMADARGLVCGYRIEPGGSVHPIAWDGMTAAVEADDSVVWLHLDQTDARARDWIRLCPHLPQHAKTLLLGTDTHMRLEPAGTGIAGVVADLHHELTHKGDQLGILRLFLDSRLLISVRRQPLAAIDKLRHSLGDGMQADRPIVLVSRFLHHVTDTLGDLVLELTEAVDRVEDALLDGEAGRSGDELSRVRRMAARLRRHMIPQHHTLAGLLTRLPSWIEQTEASRLGTAIERLAALGHDLDLVQERARLMQEQVSARLAEATNRNLYVLSIVTTIFLPVTLITGLFGMNLGGLPWNQDPNGFWYGVGVMGATAVLALAMLRLRRLL